MESKSIPWSFDEVQTFLCVVAEERIQRELNGATRNARVYQEVAQLLAAHGYHRSMKQCREKLKKFKSDYRAIKDHNGRGGSDRKTWKWFDQMDAIYGHRPASNGREGATTVLGAMMKDGKRKRSLFTQDMAVRKDLEQQELNRAQRERHIQLLLEEARKGREQEAELRRQESAQTASFNEAFLGMLGQLVQAVNNRT
ncbi:zinc finger and SCAN domain-containing protein 29-like isoform X1 [Scomber scombrus]|uniref:zinc finger and SCAN domain-containing protein 29-like isoform X1 n=1 Tax=Scomber scombrus TaxID=13677 RepID=UPI002DDA31E5|nr:zinc finger and SCAN domain-containing protein 29-like isoform X1 [Scomber scombrus]